MGYTPLEIKFRGIEQEVISCIREEGLEEARKRYNVKTPVSFRRWYNRHADGSGYNPVGELLSGQKHKFLKENRDDILHLEKIVGGKITMELFCIDEKTLSELKRVSPYRKGQSQASDIILREIAELSHKIDLLETRVAMIDDKETETARRQKRQEEEYGQFVPSVSKQIAGLLELGINAFLGNFFKYNGHMPEQSNPLEINGLLGEDSQFKALPAVEENPFDETITRLRGSHDQATNSLRER
jgi:hypothetical protein